ncbi:lipoprotein LpqH [Mycobacterium paraffinicum]|uniref:Lipoprotein LpqH n=1 Tax=Mycobacterium paraffinicum TaxID=53378 RepID=A0ABP8EZ21_9MYCO|nr:lipoprotein LpqH [Mycobacterium paraffinicum]MCV7309938.1 lipoprotein LpqH [Mycobacterium paraffinicum]
MTNRCVLAAAAIVLAAGLSGCSGEGGQPASAPSSSRVAVTTTVMIDGNKHTMTSAVSCASSAAQPNASPPESGDLTTRITVHDDTASVSLALSDEKPPMVDGFAISLTLANGRYQLPYQSTKSATQVQATKEGKSYTVTGTGEATTPGQSGTRPVTFGVHITCP